MPDASPRSGFRRTAVATACGIGAVLLLTACPGGAGVAPPAFDEDLRVSAPNDDQVLSGTVSVAAAGVGGDASALAFELGDVRVAAAPDGTAVLDTRDVPDGAYVLRATATVGAEDVADEVPVVVDNDLPSAGTVGPSGGALRSTEGSIVTLPPGALSSSVAISLGDTTQQEILDDFGIDYSALGVTFLGALTLEGSGGPLGLPVHVDLAGWANAVQPSHQVVMFATAPDGNGDGVGELVFAADAQATPNGSVITRPVPSAEVHGIGTVGALGLQQTASVRPGEIVTVVGRGFNPTGWLSNVARFGGDREVLAWPLVADDAAFNPRMEVRFAVPALGSGTRSATLHNLTTGYRSDPVSLGVLALGSGSAADWTGFVDQLDLALEALTANRPDLRGQAEGWLDTLRASGSATAMALARNSGLVSAANRTVLEGLSGSLTAAQRDLVVRHALLADAVAASVSDLAQPAADVASMLMVTAPAQLGATGLRTQQGGGGTSCSGTASSSATSVTFGNPTGMGSAPPGGCASGSGAGPNGSGALVDPASLEAATTSLRPGTFRPVAGAYVGVYRPGGDRLSPFTAFADATGYFHLPFIPPNEPFVVRAVDPATGNVASFEAVGAGIDARVPVQLTFGDASGPGSPTASFAMAPSPRGTLQGSWYWSFDASASFDPDGEIDTYLWDLAGTPVSISWSDTVYRGFGRNGTYDIGLVVIDGDGDTGVQAQQLVVDDLPYDYWGPPPYDRINENANGVVSDQEPENGLQLSADGRYAAFTTYASNLGPVDTNGKSDLYLRDMDTGGIELVSRAAAGFTVWTDIGISADARYLAYTEEDEPSFGTGPNKIVVVDRTQGTTQEIVNPDGYTRNSVATLSADGRTLVYRASTLNDSTRPAYVHDLDAGTSLRLGLRTDGATYATVRPIDLSADGRWVVFASADGGLVDGDANATLDVFVYDLDMGVTLRASEASDGMEANGASDTWGRVISADGRHVTFWSHATNLYAGDVNGVEDVFVKDLATGELQLTSTNAWGEAGDSDSVLAMISGDGRYVVFGSYSENLTPLMDPIDSCAIGWCNQGFGYVKDRETGRVVLVTVGMDDAAPNEWDQIEPIISADGRWIAFYSWASNLVPGDSADTLDYFRVENPLWEP